MKNWYISCVFFFLLSCMGSEYKSPNNNLEEQIVPTDTGTCGIITRKKKSIVKEHIEKRSPEDKDPNPENKKKELKQERNPNPEIKSNELKQEKNPNPEIKSNELKRKEVPNIKGNTPEERLKRVEEELDKEIINSTPKFGLG